MAEEFQIIIPFGAQAPAPIDVSQQDPPGGPYQVEITAVRQVTGEGEGAKTTLRFNVVIVEDGPAKGVQTMVVCGTDWSKPFNVAHMATLLMGCGIPVDKIKGNVPVKSADFVGKKTFIFVKAPLEGETGEDGRPKRADKNFQTRAQYEAQKKALATVGAAGAGGGGTKTPANGPGAPTGDTTSLQSVFGT